MSAPYKVGYGRPPTRTRFRKGQSGNPQGRPKGTRNLTTDLAEELQEKVMVNEAGVRRPISKQRAMIKGIVAKGLQGDTRAALMLIDLALRLLPQVNADKDHAALRAEDVEILRGFETRLRRRLQTGAKP